MNSLLWCGVLGFDGAGHWQPQPVDILLTSSAISILRLTKPVTPSEARPIAIPPRLARARKNPYPYMGLPNAYTQFVFSRLYSTPQHPEPANQRPIKVVSPSTASKSGEST